MLNTANPEIKRAFERGTAEARNLLTAQAKKASGEGGKGWSYRLDGGAYGVNYDFRAAIANFGLGYNLPQDAVYPSLTVDSEGQPLSGNNNYVLRLEKGKLLPVGAFWWLTAYDADGPSHHHRPQTGGRPTLLAARLSSQQSTTEKK
jgi:hypothetical protein